MVDSKHVTLSSYEAFCLAPKLTWPIHLPIKLCKFCLFEHCKNKTSPWKVPSLELGWFDGSMRVGADYQTHVGHIVSRASHCCGAEGRELQGLSLSQRKLQSLRRHERMQQLQSLSHELNPRLMSFQHHSDCHPGWTWWQKQKCKRFFGQFKVWISHLGSCSCPFLRLL